MDPSELAREIASLPPEARRQAADFVAFFKWRYRRSQLSGRADAVRLADEPFIGTWRDREDMSDSTAWVHRLRGSER